MKRWRIVLTLALTAVLTACGGAEVAPTPTAVLSAEEAQGRQVFARHCGSCHSLTADTVLVGPPMLGIAARAGERTPHQDARTYLYTAVLEPGDFIVEGYDNLMPSTFGKTLTGEELDAVVAFLLTLE